MLIVDSQLHDPGSWLDWKGESDGVRDKVLLELTFAWMDSIGVDGAILFSGRGGWADSATLSYPGRLASVPHMHPEEGDDLVQLVAEAKEHPGIVGLRSVIGWPLSGEEAERARQGSWDPFYAECERQGMPVFLFATRFLAVADEIAARFPNLTLVIDHIGLPQPPLDERETPPTKSLPEMLALAKHPNVSVKLCGLPGLSSEPLPYRDVQPVLRQFIDAFGAERLMWGSDISRFTGRIGFEGRFERGMGDYEGKHTYAEALMFIRDNDELSDAEKQLILGGAVEKILGWSPKRSVAA
jgi:hypothetical protein